MIELLAGVGFDQNWHLGMRPYWIVLGIGYFSAATYLVMSEYNFPVRTWSTFYVISVGILLFFNIDRTVASDTALLTVEFILFMGGFLGGLRLFTLLLAVADTIDSGELEVPPAHESVRRFVYWLAGVERSEADADPDP